MGNVCMSVYDAGEDDVFLSPLKSVHSSIETRAKCLSASTEKFRFFFTRRHAPSYTFSTVRTRVYHVPVLVEMVSSPQK